MQEFNALEMVQEELRKCMKCGNCQAVCPVYRETRNEGSVARGKIKMAEALLKGELEVTEKFTEKMFQCLGCMTCMSICPCGVKLDKVVFAARAHIARTKGLHPLKKVIFQVLKRPGIFDLGLKVGSRFQGLAMKKTPEGSTSTPRFPVGLDMKRVIPRIKTTMLKDLLPEVISPANGGKPKMRVGFYTGCTINHMFTEVGQAVVEVLTKNGIEVVIPKNQHCCGTPVFAHGDTVTAQEMAISNMKAFEDAKVDAVIVACGTCTSAWKHYFPNWLEKTTHHQKAVEFQNKTYEITEFLTKVINMDQNLGRVDMKVTLHDSCHMNRELGLLAEPRNLLKSIPGVELVEMKNPQACCGGAGSFSLMYYDISLGILEKKMNDAASTGADYLMTACSGCRMQLIDGTARFNPQQKVMHPVEVLNLSYKVAEQEKRDSTPKADAAAAS